jgi:membrane associated rhomboid family serine protease
MHGSLGHIISNMFSLWMFGFTLENIWGGKRFLTYYLITGLGAALLHTFVNYLEISSLQNAANAFFNTPSVDAFYSFIHSKVPAIFKSTFIGLADSWTANPSSYQLQQNAISLVNQLIETKLNIPTVGASGAVFGVLLAYGMLFPNTLLYLYFAIPIKVKYFVIVYGLFELYQGFRSNPTDNVAHFAHLGGMLFGYLLIKYWQKNRGSFY